MTPDPIQHAPSVAVVDPEPIAVDARGACRLFSVSLRTWRSWDAGGRCPMGHRVGGRKLWSTDELRRWAATGFPSRLEDRR